MDGQQKALKIAIPRLPGRGVDKPPNEKPRPRVEKPSSGACLTCRKRKTKCSGEQPQCQGCLERKTPCVYLQARRDRLKETVDKNEQLTSFLRDLGTRLSGEEKQSIEDILASARDDFVIYRTASANASKVEDEDGPPTPVAAPHTQKTPAHRTETSEHEAAKREERLSISGPSSSAHIASTPDHASMGTTLPPIHRGRPYFHTTPGHSHRPSSERASIGSSYSAYASSSRAAEDGITLPSLGDVFRNSQHDELRDQLNDHESLYHLLKTRPLDEVQDVIRQIRSGESLQDILRRIEGVDALSQLGSLR